MRDVWRKSGTGKSVKKQDFDISRRWANATHRWLKCNLLIINATRRVCMTILIACTLIFMIKIYSWLLVRWLTKLVGQPFCGHLRVVLRLGCSGSIVDRYQKCRYHSALAPDPTKSCRSDISNGLLISYLQAVVPTRNDRLTRIEENRTYCSASGFSHFSSRTGGGVKGWRIYSD